MIFEVIGAVLGIIIVRFVLIYFEHLWNLSKYPKGPFPLPLIGNANLIKSKNICETFTTLSKEYGNVFSFSMGRSTSFLYIKCNLNLLNSSIFFIFGIIYVI